MNWDNCCNRKIKPKPDNLGMIWANSLVTCRTPATLMGELGIRGNLAANQLGHSLNVNQNVYTQSPVKNRCPAANPPEKSLFLVLLEQEWSKSF